MKKIKNGMILLLVAMVSLCLSGCHDEPAPPTPDNEVTVVGKWKVIYEKIVELAHVPAQSAAGYIVKYSNGPRQNPSGLMSPGTEVYVCNKMDFNVRSTHQS